MKKKIAIEIIGMLLLISVSTVSIAGIKTANSNEDYTPRDIINISGNDGFNYNKNICDGYTLITPRYYRHPFLIDMNGTVIHQWSIYGLPAKMLPNGSIIGTRVPTKKFQDYGRTGTLYKYVSQEDWNGSITWEFCNWSNNWARQHHDFDRVGNPVYYSPGHDTKIEGNTLILARTKRTVNKSISWLPLQDAVIYEVDWNGNLTGYEWHAHEHFDEFGFDEISKKGIFLCPGGQGWLHLNTCSGLGPNKWFNQGFEQFDPKNFIICSRHANFIAVINRSTGNIVWKVGPNYYQEPDKKLGQIIGPHHAHMIPEGLPGEGNMLVFDNGCLGGYGRLGGIFISPMRYHRFYSRIIEFNPMTLDIVWEYTYKGRGLFGFLDKNRFYSAVISSVQRLPNGNTLVTEGTDGRIFEVTPEKEIIWTYYYEGKGELLGDDWVYRAYRVPPEWVPGNPAGYMLWSDLYEI